MFEKVLQHIQERMRSHAYIVTIHADEEMDNDGLRIGDIEHVIRTGHIIEHQQDIHAAAWKYLN